MLDGVGSEAVRLKIQHLCNIFSPICAGMPELQSQLPSLRGVSESLYIFEVLAMRWNASARNATNRLNFLAGDAVVLFHLCCSAFGWWPSR
jgi:hypothetical protein